MTSPFVSIPAPSQPPAPAPDLIAGDGWWPDLSLAAVRASARFDTTITDARLVEEVCVAVLEVNAQLACWRAVQVAASLTAVVGRPGLEILYRRAVVSTAAATLSDRLRSLTTTAAGADRADEAETSADMHRRNAHWAISDILARPRTTIELL